MRGEGTPASAVRKAIGDRHTWRFEGQDEVKRCIMDGRTGVPYAGNHSIARSTHHLSRPGRNRRWRVATAAAVGTQRWLSQIQMVEDSQRGHEDGVAWPPNPCPSSPTRWHRCCLADGRRGRAQRRVQPVIDGIRRRGEKSRKRVQSRRARKGICDLLGSEMLIDLHSHYDCRHP